MLLLSQQRNLLYRKIVEVASRDFNLLINFSHNDELFAGEQSINYNTYEK